MRLCTYRCGVVCGRQPVLLSTMTLRSPPVLDATNVLVNQNDANVLPCGERLERGLNRSGVGLAVHDQEVLLLVGSRANVLHNPSVTVEPKLSFLRGGVLQCLRGGGR